MASELHPRMSRFMSHTNERGALPVRSIPRVAARHRPHGAAEEVDERTTVDARRAPVAFTTPVARRVPEPSRHARAAKPSPPPANVIPFTKPRAIAALAAANPDAVAIQATPASAPLARDTFSAGNAAPSAPPAGAPPAPLPALRGPHAAAPSLPAPPALSSPYAPPIYTGQAALALGPQPLPVEPLPAPVSEPASMFHAEAPTPYSPAAAEVVARPDDRWAVFEKLGLGKPKEWTWERLRKRLGTVDAQRASRWLVSAYRLLGFSILTIIVVVLVGYITTTAFFYVSDSWIVPMAVTPSDEKVVTLRAQVSAQQDQRDRIADELNQAERAIVAQQTFQAEFEKAIRGDLANRKAALERWRSLASSAAGTRATIQSQNRAYAGAARRRMQREYAAGLIDRNAMLSGKFQLAQISSSNLSLAERQAEYETRAAELEATARSLDAILSGASETDDDDGGVALSFEVLQIKQQYETSRLELAKAVENRDSLAASLARQDEILAALEGSAYLRALDDEATVAFVPYGNLAGVEPGAPLYACKLTMIICFEVGKVLEVLPGEVQFRHPHRDKNLRGQLVEIELHGDDADAAMEDHLFVGGKPFLL